jgi:branched-chain amino acid transport system permease protein
MTWVNAAVQGMLLGGLYTLFATGLSLIFGVMRVVNLAHGVLTLLAAFLAFVVVDHTGLNPLFALAMVVPAMFVLGYVVQRLVINFTLGSGVLPPLLVTFGLAVITENVLLKAFSADSRGLDAGRIEDISIRITSRLAIGWLPLTIFLVAVVIVVGLQLFFRRTMFGRALRATSDDQEAAQLMAINNRHVYAMAMGMALAIAGAAGVFVGIRTTFGPLDGPVLLIFAFEAVIIGGLGSLWGTLVGGVILGVAQTVGEQIAIVGFHRSGWFQLSGHLLFLAVLAIRPTGLFARAGVAE